MVTFTEKEMEKIIAKAKDALLYSAKQLSQLGIDLRTYEFVTEDIKAQKLADVMAIPRREIPRGHSESADLLDNKAKFIKKIKDSHPNAEGSESVNELIEIASQAWDAGRASEERNDYFKGFHAGIEAEKDRRSKV